MAFDAGSVLVDCPHCGDPITVPVQTNSRRRFDGTLAVTLTVKQPQFDTLFAEHVAKGSL